MADNPFSPVTDKEESDSYWTEIVQTKPSVTVWTKDQKFLIKTYVLNVEPLKRTFQIFIPNGLDYQTLPTIAEEAEGKFFYFSVSTARANIFFKTYLLESRQVSVAFYYPDQLFKVQRRQNPRMNVEEKSPPFYFEFLDPGNFKSKIKKKVIDLSTGGVAILAATDEESIFLQDTILHKGILTVRNKGSEITIPCEGVVKHFLKRTEKKAGSASKNFGLKVGVQFTQIDVKDQALLSELVEEENNQIFSKYL